MGSYRKDINRFNKFVKKIKNDKNFNVNSNSISFTFLSIF